MSSRSSSLRAIGDISTPRRHRLLVRGNGIGRTGFARRSPTGLRCSRTCWRRATASRTSTEYRGSDQTDQAGGALSWTNSDLRGALISAALKGTTPTLFLVAQNDRTVASIITLADIFKKRGIPHRSVIYAPWPPGASAGTLGHAIFSANGAAVWEADVVEFLGGYLSPSR